MLNIDLKTPEKHIRDELHLTILFPSAQPAYREEEQRRSYLVYLGRNDDYVLAMV